MCLEILYHNSRRLDAAVFLLWSQRRPTAVRLHPVIKEAQDFVNCGSFSICTGFLLICDSGIAVDADG